MPRKKANYGVTFNLGTGSDKKVTKRKKKPSGNREQSGSKKQHLARRRFRAVLGSHREDCDVTLCSTEIGVRSVLSGKRIVDFENVQAELSGLKKRLLQHYKKLKFPSVQMENLKNVRKDLAEEKRKLEHNQEMLESLNNEVEKAVEESYAIEESTKALEEKLESLTQQAAEDVQTLGNVTNSDSLQLPKATFMAVPFQEKVKKLKNPNAVLKELVLMEENPAYRGMRKLIEKSFNEISNSTS
ncbi:centromere protein Q isoform X4 [Aquarana catesbeiana]|uniref:centromere protein Q isoform X4 n=1 Tax=Aquarana catesbeiana TaxID=8400 RepID=UPI003CC93E13